MKILVVGDCHGVKPDVDEAGESADVILAVGDICSDSDRMRDAMFASMDSEKEFYDILGREKAKEAVERSLKEGEEVLGYLDSFNTPVFVVPGNWDWNGEEEGWEFLDENRFQELVEKCSSIHNINGESFRDSDYCYIGYGPCPGPEVPQHEDEKPENREEMEEIRREYERHKDEIEELFREAEKPVIFLSHNVPHKTSLDRIENPDSPADGRHYGSLVVRDMIEDFRPVLNAAGHMHEGYGCEEVENTLALNAGLHSHVLIEIENGEIDRVDFHPSKEGY
ncbi:MAG: metallophosphoesterase [Candidatus Nanosalina sp.]